MRERGFVELIVVLLVLILVGVGLVLFVGKSNLNLRGLISNNSLSKKQISQSKKDITFTEGKALVKKVDKFVYIDGGDVALLDLKTKEKKKLTNYGYNASPVLSPDGSKIAYLSVPKSVVETGNAVKGSNFWSYPYSTGSDGGFMNVWVINADGTNPVKLTDFLAKRSSITWSADNSKIAFEEDGTILEYSLGDGIIKKVASEGKAPVYSPTNSYLAYLTWGEHKIVLKLPGGDRKISNNKRVGDLNWSATEDVVFYTSFNEEEKGSGDYWGPKLSVWAYSIPDGIKKQITDESLEMSEPIASPDSSYIAVRQGSGGGDAGYVDMDLVLLKIDADLNIEKQLEIEEFKGQSFFEEWADILYPVSLNNNVWLNEKEILTILAPDQDIDWDYYGYYPGGYYILNVRSLTAERLLELSD